MTTIRRAQELAQNGIHDMDVGTSGGHSDALVFFGATGDLAYKKIFPALQASVRLSTDGLANRSPSLAGHRTRERGV
jgi:6-phosphogluconate dehydrogenase (decarboxylating)